MRLRITVEDASSDDLRVIAVVGVDPPDDKGVCRVEVAERGGRRYSGTFPARAGRRPSQYWLPMLKAALRSLR